jgi:hypothetical protein
MGGGKAVQCLLVLDIPPADRELMFLFAREEGSIHSGANEIPLKTGDGAHGSLPVLWVTGRLGRWISGSSEAEEFFACDKKARHEAGLL